MEKLCGTGFSKSTVSDLCKQLDPVVSVWIFPTLMNQCHSFVVVDVMVQKVREEDRATVVLTLPEKCRKRFRITNILERMREVIRPRQWVIRIFPNRESAVYLFGFLLRRSMKDGSVAESIWT
jgi:transposase-like protein